MSRRTKPDRYGLRFLTCLLAAPTVQYILSGASSFRDLEPLKPYIVLGVLLGTFHIIIRPVLRLLSIVPGCLIALFSGILIDIGLIYLGAYLIPSIPMPSILYSILTCILINVICGVLSI